jgi:hypothetical protein
VVVKMPPTDTVMVVELETALKGSWKTCGVVVIEKSKLVQSRKSADAWTLTNTFPAEVPHATKPTVEGVPPVLP